MNTLRRRLGHLYRRSRDLAYLRRGRRSERVAQGVVVSLTSFPQRIGGVPLVVESILRQSVRPERIVLALSRPEFGTSPLPKRVTRYVDEGLTIIWTPDNTRSYKKLLPTLRAFPEDSIVTIDDDVIYRPWFLETLLNAAKSSDCHVLGFRGREVTCSQDSFAPYRSFPSAHAGSPSAKVLLTGVGGVLYRSNSLAHRDLHNVKLIAELCPTADDLWFWAMARLSGAKTGIVEAPDLPCREIEQQLSTPNLHLSNSLGGQNDLQLSALDDHFNLRSLVCDSKPGISY